jgi:dolichyl-phosphate beta-glucosyltransferase
MAARATVVIPCYDEIARLHPSDVRELVAGGLDVVLVDDGSTDGTAAVLDDLAAADPSRVHAVRLGEHRGKGEAVRRGLLRARETGAAVVGYGDADFATPAEELLRLAAVAVARSDVLAVVGSRSSNAPNVRRTPWRALGGRLFSVVGSRAIGRRLRDTQCGAKFFRADGSAAGRFDDAIADGFRSDWAFDVELLARLVRGRTGSPDARQVLEVPLRSWRDVPGTKLRRRAAVRAWCDLVVMPAHLRGWRRIG